jgi:hypothetical protein
LDDLVEFDAGVTDPPAYSKGGSRRSVPGQEPGYNDPLVTYSTLLFCIAAHHLKTGNEVGLLDATLSKCNHGRVQTTLAVLSARNGRWGWGAFGLNALEANHSLWPVDVLHAWAKAYGSMCGTANNNSNNNNNNNAPAKEPMRL